MKMRTLLGLLALVVASLAAVQIEAQKGGRGGKGGKGKGGKGGGRFDPVRELLAPKFVKVTPSASGQAKTTDGEAAAYFESLPAIKDAAKNGHVSLLYIFDKSDAKKLETFEDTLLTYKSEALMCAFRVFKLAKLDTADDTKVKALYEEKQMPMFLAFDNKGKLVGDVSMKGYRPSTKSLMKLLNKATKGHGKMKLATFVKKYRSFVNKFDQLLRDEKGSKAKLERLEGDTGRRARGKLKKAKAEAEKLAKLRTKLFATEKKLREDMIAPIEKPKADLDLDLDN